MKATFDAAPAPISRRFLLAGLGAGALVLSTGQGRRAGAQEIRKYGAEALPGGIVDDPRLFLAIGEDGTVTVICKRSEMGQGIRTSLALVIADELAADWSRVKISQALGDEIRYGNQNTDGSRSMRHDFLPMRRCAAAARTMLEQAAAHRWAVPVDQVAVRDHAVIHAATGRTLGFGNLAAAAAALPVPARQDMKLKPPSAFRYIGKGNTPLCEGPDIVSGRAIYGIDVRLEGMLHAVVARPPVYGGRIIRFDEGTALKVPGVIKLVTIDPVPTPSGFEPVGGVAVIAQGTWAAMKGREALAPVWDDGPNRGHDSPSYRQQMEQLVRQPAKAIRASGDADGTLQRARHRIVAEYYMPCLSHAPMEPPAAVARVTADKAELWVPTQAPEFVRSTVAQRLGLAADKVIVHVTMLGGGFGRKSKPDYAVEAALISRAMDGVAVKVTWTREDDLLHGYYHTVSLARLEAGLDHQGRVSGWLHRAVSPSNAATFVASQSHNTPLELGLGLTSIPFDIKDFRIENPGIKPQVRIGWFRSVNNLPNCFAVQSFVAELAHAARRDPKDFLLELIGPPRRYSPHDVGDTFNYEEDPALYPVDTGRLRQVIEVAAKEIGWGRTLPPRHGLGIAVHNSYGSYVAVAIEAAVDATGMVKIARADVAIDCGPQINPDRIRSQMEGSVLMGFALATKGEMTFQAGRAQQSNFDTYELPRMDEAPREIHVHAVGDDFDVPLGGVGEPGIPPVAPALCNAIFAATGQRIRSLPIRGQLGGA